MLEDFQHIAWNPTVVSERWSQVLSCNSLVTFSRVITKMQAANPASNVLISVLLNVPHHIKIIHWHLTL